MKGLIFIFLSTSIAFCFAQSKMPVIKASSKRAVIIEGNNQDRYDWFLSPETRPDIHIVSKCPSVKRVKFYTDIDSIKFDIKPNEKFDFIVLLNNKDSCYTRIESPAIKKHNNQKPSVHDTIPFILTAFNNIVLKLVLDDKDTLNLKFDSGTTDFLLTNDAIKRLGLKKLNGHVFKLGKHKWENQIIYPVELSGQGTEGRFGWNLFDGKIVEINYDQNIFIIHSKLSNISKAYTKFEIEYSHTLFCISGELQIKNKEFKNRFLFDNGYQKTIMLDTLIMTEQGYPKDLDVIKKVIMQDGQGNKIPVITVNNEQFHLGKNVLLNIPVQLMTTGNPAGFKTHILGNEVLKRFNTILDFQNNYVYLKPNSLINLPYSDAR